MSRCRPGLRPDDRFCVVVTAAVEDDLAIGPRQARHPRPRRLPSCQQHPTPWGHHLLTSPALSGTAPAQTGVSWSISHWPLLRRRSTTMRDRSSRGAVSCVLVTCCDTKTTTCAREAPEEITPPEVTWAVLTA